MEGVFQGCVLLCSGLLTVSNFLLLWLRPLRERLTGEKRVKEGEKCLLRCEMLSIYFRRQESKALRQYERENFDLLYKSYKALGGNSFIEDVYEEVRGWRVMS